MTGEKKKPSLVTTTSNKRVLLTNQTEEEFSEMHFRKNPNVSVEYNANHKGRFDFITYSGASINSYYGYAAILDAISRPFAIALTNGEYESAMNCQVYCRLTDQYQKIVETMASHYSSEFIGERLQELKEVYLFLLEMNVYQPIIFSSNRLFPIHKMLESLKECISDKQVSKIFARGSSENSLKIQIQHLRDKSGAIESEEGLKTLLTQIEEMDKDQKELLTALGNIDEGNIKQCLELIRSRSSIILPFANQYSKLDSVVHMRFKNMARIKQLEATFQSEINRLKGIATK